MTPSDAYLQATHLAKYTLKGHRMDTEAGKEAFRRTGAMTLQTPSESVKERFIEYYNQAQARIDAQNEVEIKKIKELLK